MNIRRLGMYKASVQIEDEATGNFAKGTVKLIVSESPGLRPAAC